jgi:hypothetical protein
VIASGRQGRRHRRVADADGPALSGVGQVFSRVNAFCFSDVAAPSVRTLWARWWSLRAG